MKKILIILMCISIFAVTCSFSISAETNSYNITELEGKYKTQGRTDIVDGTLFLDWSASGIEFNANCSGNVSIKVNTTRIKSGGTGGLYFTVIVDGVVQYENQRIPSNNNANSWTSNSTNYPFKIQNQGISEFTIAKNLSPGSHTFKIYNQTEPLHGTFGIQSITLNGEFLPPKSNNDLYIEFVGDSITAGLGNISVGGSGAPLYQDATRGWPYLTAKKLKSDWSVIAQSGITASDGIGWAGANSISMQAAYPKTRYLASKNYDFKRSADVIVLCLGTNDFWTYKSGGKTLDYLKSEFKAMLKLLQKNNPNAKVVWIHGMMINDADTLIKTVIEESGGADKGLYTLSLPKNLEGGQGHPGLAIQKTYAEKVSNFINNILNGKNKEDTTQSKPVNSTSSFTNTDSIPSQSKPQTSTPASTSSNNSKPQSKPDYNSSADSNKDNKPQGQLNNTDDSSSKSEDNSSDESTTSNSEDKQNKPNKNAITNKSNSSKKLLFNIILVVVDVALVAVFVLLFIKLKRKK